MRLARARDWLRGGMGGRMGGGLSFNRIEEVLLLVFLEFSASVSTAAKRVKKDCIASSSGRTDIRGTFVCADLDTKLTHNVTIDHPSMC